ncbi:response regulator [Leptolyngbya sp. FACHB-261]|uniref:response regulator n=1 Tax=Leptolyngbya sp. FACHB-261 TaxID=2692806 RepID=UPI0016892E27|nr:response regulator [Leptolyngbya sp. FACHB-261]MBD2099865.1 response regulator [Leptolyngbya sp. FACHB-261]
MKKPLLILVVDDDDDNQVLAVQILKLLDYACISASDGYMALELSHRYHPDLILLDIAMPDLSGLEVVHRLKTNLVTASIPVIALTAMAMVGDRELALAAGFDEYLAKPYSVEQLETTIQQTLASFSSPVVERC